MSTTELAEAPENPTVESSDPPPTAKKRSNLVPALVLAAGMVAAAFLLKPAPAADAAAEATTTTEPAGPAVALEPMTLNLRDGRFLRIGVAIELGESADAKEFEKHGSTNRLKDLIIFEVAELGAEELSTSEGLDGLKARLAHGAEELYGEEFHSLYLTDLVVQ